MNAEQNPLSDETLIQALVERGYRVTTLANIEAGFAWVKKLTERAELAERRIAAMEPLN